MTELQLEAPIEEIEATGVYDPIAPDLFETEFGTPRRPPSGPR